MKGKYMWVIAISEFLNPNKLKNRMLANGDFKVKGRSCNSSPHVRE